MTVHYTADGDVAATRKALMTRHLGYHLVIDRAGVVWQFAEIGMMVAHAGMAKWLGKSPNRSHAAVALSSWGQLDKRGCNWLGERVDPTKIAMRYGNVGHELQFWEKATQEQESALRLLLLWFVHEGVLPGNICGHDECALPLGRKADPGGVLAMRMQEVRNSLLP